MKWLNLSLFIIILFSFFSCPSSPKEPPSKGKPKLSIAVAANVQFAIKEIIAAFESGYDAEVAVVIGSSGKLTAQIIQGAPYHLFISADTKYPEVLKEAGKASGESMIYAKGALVLWTFDETLDLARNPSFLLNDKIKKIAIANPVTAPYGEETVRLLEYYGLYEKLKNKLVLGESIAQTNQYISSAAVEVGITAKSVVVAPEMAGKGKWLDLERSAYNLIEQAAIITEYGHLNEPEASKAFLDFLRSKAGQQIFSQYGYEGLE
ncbi:MAG TPA: molybdate ABC transporter substrate-binding protein [Saprospiraceae bacterium]|nr:molybdate ABC transporter substrate-binding protein [Saprospiraceae bacterium]HMQ85229.1 molybdate ABC transporter substrate-binding protein [Saprospiraceae bacterium]